MFSVICYSLGLGAIFSVVAEANRYFAGEAPWALAKTDPARQKTVLYVTAEVVRQVAILTQPVMPGPNGLSYARISSANRSRVNRSQAGRGARDPRGVVAHGIVGRGNRGGKRLP